jgi:hypothetical protein
MNKLNIWIQKHQNKLTASIAVLIAISLAAKFLVNLPTVSTIAMIVASIIGAIPVALHAISALQNKLSVSNY